MRSKCKESSLKSIHLSTKLSIALMKRVLKLINANNIPTVNKLFDTASAAKYMTNIFSVPNSTLFAVLNPISHFAQRISLFIASARLLCHCVCLSDSFSNILIVWIALTDSIKCVFSFAAETMLSSLNRRTGA